MSPHLNHIFSRQIPRWSLLLLAAVVLGLGGCKKDRELDDGKSAAELYQEAKRMLENRAYDRAVRQYRLLQTRYPFGRYAEQAQLEMAYAYYKAGQTEQALATTDRFIRTYPTHPNVDYAFYIRGLTNYEQKVGFLERMMPSRIRDRDQSAALEAFADFEELCNRFPDSRYAPDARQRMVFLRNNLSYYEIDVARYYMKRKAYVASANRARYLLETYPNSPEAGNALEILHISYTAMGLTELADDSLRILEMNYPAHPYVNGGAKRDGFWAKLWPFE